MNNSKEAQKYVTCKNKLSWTLSGLVSRCVGGWVYPVSHGEPFKRFSWRTYTYTFFFFLERLSDSNMKEGLEECKGKEKHQANHTVMEAKQTAPTSNRVAFEGTKEEKWIVKTLRR